MDVLLSIKPKFAEAIIDGRKRYEFRKSKFAKKDINRVYIYSIYPVKKIIGAFRISNIIEDRPRALWDRLKDYAGISEEEFFNYFSDSKKGFALEIKDVVKFENPIDPETLIPNFVPPQSFYYIKNKNQTARGHPTLKGWGMLRAARPVSRISETSEPSVSWICTSE